MPLRISAAQLEATIAKKGEAQVASVMVEAPVSTPDQPVKVAAAQIEHVLTQPDMAVRTHAAQYESLHVNPPGEARVGASQVEVLHPMTKAETEVRTAGVVIEVLRTIPGKKRKPPINVVAN